MDETAKYFPKNMSKRERAIFECGIALGTLYHTFVGTPLRLEEEDIRRMERLMEASISAQPFREKVEVKIHPPKSLNDRPFNYFVLRGRHIEAKVVINYLGERVVGRMDYKKELNYTLMYISDEAP